MAPSIWQILIVIVLAMLLFGRGRISGVMEDLAKGIKSFKRGMKDEEEISPPVLENRKSENKEPENKEPESKKTESKKD